MYFTSPNTTFLAQGALPWTPVKDFAPGPYQGPYRRAWTPTRGFLRFAFDVSPSKQFLKVKSQWRIQDGIPPGVQTEDGVLAPLGKLKNGAPRRRCWMGEGGSMLEVIISFSDNVIG